jgi:hypothetical protein
LRQCQCDDPEFRNYSDLQATGEIVNGYWMFNTDIKATKAVMTYLARNLDEDCMMIMYENQERAVRAYISWNFTRTYYELYPPNISESYRQEWMAQRRFLIGEAYQRDYLNNRTQVGSIYRALVNNQNFAI